MLTATRSLLSAVLLSHHGLGPESKGNLDKECGLSYHPPGFESGVPSAVALGEQQVPLAPGPGSEPGCDPRAHVSSQHRRERELS